jgi:hypothetical protein
MTDLITSVNTALFEQYGRQMVAGFEKFADADIRLIVVFEGPMPSDLIEYRKRCVFVPFSSPDHQRFLKFFGDLYEAHGFKLIVSKAGEIAGVERNYLFDAVRFSFKVFAIEIGRRFIGEDSSFAWIDADVRCLKPFSSNDLEPFLPRADELMSYLGRDRQTFDCSECGFLGFNAAHPRIADYLQRVRSLYLTGEIFSLRQRHDSWLWDEVRREFERTGTKFRDISGAASASEHPFINCGLGEFFDHLKGPDRKKIGRSPKEDYILRKEPQN